MGGSESKTVVNEVKKCLVLWKNDMSPPSRAVMMTAEAIQLELFKLDVNLQTREHKTADFTAMNPQQTVPTIRDGKFYIWDSHVISSYLVTMYSQDKKLYPADAKQRALVDNRFHLDTGVLQARLMAAVYPVFFGDATSIPEEKREAIMETYCLLETILNGGNYLAGCEMTLADICCVATISTMNLVVPVTYDYFPNLYGWLDRMSKECFYERGNSCGLFKFNEKLQSKLCGKK